MLSAGVVASNGGLAFIRMISLFFFACPKNEPRQFGRTAELDARRAGRSPEEYGRSESKAPTGSCEYPHRSLTHRAQIGNKTPFICALPMSKRAVRHSYKWDPKSKATLFSVAAAEAVQPDKGILIPCHTFVHAEDKVAIGIKAGVALGFCSGIAHIAKPLAY